MKKRTYKLAFLLSVVFAVSTEIPSQTKSDTTETASARIDVVNRDFYIAIDKQNVRLLKAVISEYEKLIPLVKERGDRRTEAKILTRAAEAAALTGQMPAALDKLRNALETWESLGEPQEAANILTTIGNVQYVVEDYRAAHDTLERALKLGGRADRIGELDTLIALAGVFKALRDPEKSISTYQDALIISRDGADRYAEGFILERIWIPRKAERLEYLNKAVEAYRAADQEPTSKSSIVNRILTATGNRIDSSTRSEAARFRRFKTEADKQEFLRTSRSAGVVPLDFDVGDRGRGPDLLVTAGSYYLGSGDRKRALDLYLEALNWARQDKYENTEQRILPFLAGYYGGVEKDEEKNTYYFTLLNLHLLYRGARTAFDSNGSPLNARAAIEFGLISIETGQKKLVSNELRTAFAAETQRHYSRFIDLLMEIHNADPAGGHDGVALKAAELARSRGLLDALTSAGVDFRKGISPELVDREREIQSKLNTLAERAARSSSINPSGETPRSVTDQISALVLEYAEIHGKIRQEKLKGITAPKPDPERYARIRSEFWLMYFKDDNPTEPLPFTLFDIQNEIIEADTVLLEYYIGGKKSYLWEVTKESIESYELPGRSEIENLARSWYSQLSHSPLSDTSREPVISREAASLSDIVLGPVADHLVGKRIVIVADGALQYLPFSALPQPKVKRATESNRSGFLAMTNEIVNLPSASALVVLRSEAASRKEKGAGIAVIADPVFSETDERLARQKALPKSSAADNNRTLLQRAFNFTTRDKNTVSIPRLPFTRREANSILSSAPKNASLKSLDFAADREKVLTADLSKYRVIHFATHGILHSDHPELSGLVLSLVNEEGETVNGFLRLNEIYNMNLNADLVVLSACQTALGKEVRGEGLIGLTRGFMYAGSPRVVASLWKVDDVATVELMKIFYQKMLKERMRPAAALRAAKIAMMKQKRWSSPYYWAAFELQGDWR